MNLFWHKLLSSSDLPAVDAGHQQITYLGTINKGESKWFAIPAAYYPNFNTEIRGFGLSYGIQASDFLEVEGVGTHIRSGEVNVVWEEDL